MLPQGSYLTLVNEYGHRRYYTPQFAFSLQCTLTVYFSTRAFFVIILQIKNKLNTTTRQERSRDLHNTSVMTVISTAPPTVATGCRPMHLCAQPSATSPQC